MTRGYAAIGLDRPKDAANIGGVLRAVGCYDAALLVIGGGRFQRSPADTMKQHRHTPVVEVADVRLAAPHDAVPVAVEIVEGARPLHQYVHPHSAFYVFGPEDGSISDEVRQWCRDVVYVPTRHCMNLAATVNVVLYDRLAKSLRRAA
jgi:tRNA(Leu) C34 or U34 (ribose-2'-O)-methylase TrmL